MLNRGHSGQHQLVSLPSAVSDVLNPTLLKPQVDPSLA